MTRLEELKQQEKSLLLQLEENKNEQRAINTEEFLNKYGIKFGDTIQFEDGSKTVTGVFDRLTYSQSEPRYPIVKLFNADGKPGKREAQCWWSGLNTIKVVKSA